MIALLGKGELVALLFLVCCPCKFPNDHSKAVAVLLCVLSCGYIWGLFVLICFSSLIRLVFREGCAL